MKIRFGIAAAAAAITAPAWAATSLPEQMKLLIEQRRALDAFNLGLEASDLIGDPLYDYYFGVAAVDSGHGLLGVMALERFLLADPSNILARLELGRAYFKLGDYVRARQEFKTALAAHPPSSVIATISKFMDAMAKPGGQEKKAFGAFVEVAGGGTSNANSGISGSSIDLPGFGTVTLGESGVRQASGLATVSAGSFASIPLMKRIRLNGSVSGYYRTYSNVPDYDMASFNGTLGLGTQTDKLTASVSGVYGNTLLNGAGYRQNYGAMAYMRKPLGKSTAVSIDGGYQLLRYKALNQNRNGSLTTASLTIDRKVKLPGKPIFSMTGYYGRERNSQGRGDFARRILGGRLGVAATIAPKVTLSTSAGLARWRYDAEDLLFGTLRRDWYKSADGAVQFELSRGLTLRVEAQYVQDDANIPLYRFSQKQAALVLRREWQ